jgi:transcription elongation factor GreA-like protein
LRQFSGLFLTLYHNVMPSKGLGIQIYMLLANQEYARC